MIPVAQSTGVECWQVAVVGGERSNSDKAYGSVVDVIQFIEKTFGGTSVDYVAIIYGCHYNQVMLHRVAQRRFVTAQKTNSIPPE